MTRDASPSRLHRLEPWVLLSFGLPAIAVLLSRMDVNDLAYHLRAGSIMAETGTLLRHDVFTFTVAGTPWLNQQWGAQLALSPMFDAVGWRGLVVVRALVVAGCTGSVYWIARGQGADSLVAGSLTLGGFVVAASLPGTLALRPQLLALPLFVVALTILTTRREQPWRLAMLLPIGVVWVNLHGSFVLLFILCVVATLGEAARARRIPWVLGAVTLVVGLLPLATPWGWETYGYVADVISSPVVRDQIDEWQLLWEQWPGGVAFALVAGLVIIAARRHRLRPLDPVDVAISAVLTGLAVSSGRHVIWWALALPVVGARVLDPEWRPGSDVPRRVTVAVAVALGVTLTVGVARVATTMPTEALLGEAPAGISSALTKLTAPGDRVLNARWGSWFELASPEARVAVDARVELFPDDVWDRFFVVATAAPGWERVLDDWDVRVVVAGSDDHPSLVCALLASPGWERAYEDADGLVFVRSDL